MKNRERIFSLEQRVDFLERKLVQFEQNDKNIGPKPQFTVTCSRENHKEVLGLLFLDFYKFFGTLNWDDAVHDCVVATSDRKCCFGELQTIEGWQNLPKLTIEELAARVDQNQRERMIESKPSPVIASEKPTWAQGEYKHSEPEPEPKKTVQQWLEELPDGYRERALSQMNERKANTVCKSMHGAILDFTSWKFTIEGNVFWNEVDNHYLVGTPLPPLPTEQYNAGFWWNNVDNLNLPDGTYIYFGIASKTWQKFRRLQRSSQPHTLTQVTKYTVSKFYYLGGDKNHYERYALCVKIDSEVSLVIPRNVSGIITIGIVSASQDDDTIFEVTPVK